MTGGIDSSMFSSFQTAPGDPILSLQPRFAADTRPDKVNLGIGMYYDDYGRLPILRSVSAALAQMQEQTRPAPYLPMAGDATYRRAVQQLLFGAGHARVEAGQVATVQSIGGTGALKIGAEVLQRHFPLAEVWVSEPTWDNHLAIFAGAGFAVRRYPYFDAATGRADFAAMAACLAALAEQSIVILHPCCHNPTGADLDAGQWAQVADIVRARRLIAFFDFAYQGFGAGVEEDCLAIRAMADAGLSFLVANSFSKNFALYSERCGALSMVCQSRAEAGRALGQMELAVRGNYSSPPRHGAAIVAAILGDTGLKALWLSEVEAMRRRMDEMRSALVAAIGARRPDGAFRQLLAQRGMFGYSGLSPAAVAELRDRHAIYLTDSGRLCVAGLHAGNVERVAEVLAQLAL